jgi:asparagine N-glycosylation enzyme membrane subunit Stt3
MSKDTRDTLLARHIVVAVSMAGAALAFILSGREPGWTPFLASAILAVLFLIATTLRWQGRAWLGVLALAVLMLSIFWNPDKPMNTVFGVVIAFLSVLNAQGGSSEDEEAPKQPETLADPGGGRSL